MILFLLFCVVSFASEVETADFDQFVFNQDHLGCTKFRVPCSFEFKRKESGEFIVPEIQYPLDAFEPYISNETMHYHYNVHFKKYCEEMNTMARNKGLFENRTKYPNLHTMLLEFNNEGEPFNQQALQCWNHAVYFHNIKPPGQRKESPEGPLLDSIIKRYGSYKNFRLNVLQTFMFHFGSGWGWFTREMDGDKVVPMPTPNQRGIIGSFWHLLAPMGVVDLWEHAYYLDHHNQKLKYLETFLDHLVDWEFVEKNFEYITYFKDYHAKLREAQEAKKEEL